MVNQDFVNKYLKGKDPLRQRVLVEELIPGVTKLGGYIPWQIVGIYHNVHTADQRDENPEMLIPFYQIPWPQAGFAVRTSENPSTMLTSISAAVHQVDSSVALAQPKTLDDVVDESMADQRFTLILFASFAAVALFLAGLGIYGVMSFSVAQRAHEIALRMALGATRERVIGLIIRDGVLLAAIGLGLGLIGAYFVGRAMQSLLFGVQALDFAAFLSVAAVLLAAAILASFLPATRAGASLSTLDGSCAASHMPVIPPSESPAKSGRSMPSSSSRPMRSPARSAIVYGPGGTSEPPWPRWS